MSRSVCANWEADYLLSPSVDEWLPGDHLARLVVEMIEQLDLSALTVSRVRIVRTPSGGIAGTADLRLRQ